MVTRAFWRGIWELRRKGHCIFRPLSLTGSPGKLLKNVFGKLVWCALLLVLPAWSQVKIVKLKDPVPLSWSNFAFSYDGKVMAANYGGEIFRWTSTGGFKDLGPGDPFNSSIGISADRNTIVSGI